MPPGMWPDIRVVLEMAAAEAARALEIGPAAGFLLRGRQGAPELAGAHASAGGIGRALDGVGGSPLVSLVRRADGPFLVRASALPAGADAVGLAATLRAHEIAALAVVPLLGELGAVGCIVLPVPGDWAWPRARKARMDLCVAPAALQLEAGRAVLEAILHVEQVRGMGGLAGAVVVDGEERVILADGTVRDIGEWRGADPFGRPLRELPPAPLRDSVSVPARGGDGAARVLLVPSPLPEATATPWPLRLAARVHAAADALRGALATGGAGRQAPSTAEWTPAETVREARGLAWAFADQAIAAGTMVGVDLAEVANAVLADQAEGLSYGRVRVFSFIAPAACPLPADLLTVRSVIHALMARARASLAPGGGTLTVRTWLEEDWACAAVSDDAGASRAREAQGPQPVSEAPGAEGDRDLREAADAVESLGGRFDVERRPGVWNRCTLMLPRDPSKVVKPRRTETKARRAPDGGLSVLVVDDNPALRSVLRRYLERRGHRITEAADGDDALRVLARGERYDRLIVDVQMPGRSGPELFGSLETVAPDLRHRTLFMTGDLMEAATERFLAESGRPAIAKPFDLAEIARRVEGAA